jgi:hypothetical protein
MLNAGELEGLYKTRHKTNVLPRYRLKCHNKVTTLCLSQHLLNIKNSASTNLKVHTDWDEKLLCMALCISWCRSYDDIIGGLR